MNICHHCGQKIKQARKETLNKQLVTSLQTAAVHITSSGRNDFDLHELFNNTNAYNNFQKLRLFGLVHHVTKNGQRVRGHWLITRNGWAFLRGERSMHKWVKVQNNSIIEHSPELISVQDVYRGSEVIVTTFEYFDEYGNQVGYRPIQQSRQGVLTLDDINPDGTITVPPGTHSFYGVTVVNSPDTKIADFDGSDELRQYQEEEQYLH